MKSFQKKTQQGFSLVELLLVLGAIALIAIAAFYVYPSVKAGTQANSESSNVTAIAANVKALFGNTNSYADLDGTAAGQRKALFPSEMTNGGGSAAVNVWGGTVTLLPDGDQTKYDITYPEVPSAACVKFVSGVAANFVDVQVGGETIFDAATKRPSPALIASQCGAADPTNVIFVGN